MKSNPIKQLGAAVTLQAVKDYFSCKKPEKKQEILADLRSKWVCALTGGTSANVAEQLELHPEEIKARLFKHIKEEENCNERPNL